MNVWEFPVEPKLGRGLPVPNRISLWIKFCARHDRVTIDVIRRKDSANLKTLLIEWYRCIKAHVVYLSFEGRICGLSSRGA